MCQEMFFLILATAISGMPTPEIGFSPGQFRLYDLVQGKPRRVTQCLWIERTTFQLRGGHSTAELSPPQRNLRRQCLGVRKCYDVQLGRYWETKDTRKTIKLSLIIIYHDSMQKFLSDFDRRSHINRKQLGTLTFWVCGRMSALFFVQRTFDWDGWNGFVWRGRCRDWGTIGPQVRTPVNRWRRKIFCPLGIMFWT